MSEKTIGSNSGPGWKKYPAHRISARPAQVRVRVTFKGQVIADTRNAIQMEEAIGDGKSTVAPIVYYIPRVDVEMDRLVRTQHRTYCPFKGNASYFSIASGPENAVWSYEQPYDEVADIKDLLAFYPEKVDAIEISRE
jgi:uncharacterized protein (DUF427 family)